MTSSADRGKDAAEPRLDGDSETRESGGSAKSGSSGDSEEFESWLRDAAQAEPPSQVSLPQPGRVISGKYRIEQELGRGGMGAVYRATHVVSDKPVALKWMLRSASDERARERFTREARAAGRIDHPNVVDVYDIGEEGDAAFLVMELLRGESLRHRMTKGPLEPSEAVDLLLPAMRGVAAANKQGVIHRDLKPDNIFLCTGPEGEPREAKVLDFGISTINEPKTDSQQTLTKEGTLLGTPAYMSPEQLESARDLDARADVYALGVILYECLTGKLPFAADSYSALVLAIAKGQATPPREHRPELPTALEAVVLRALAKERFASVDEFIDALTPFSTLPSEARISNPALPSPARQSRLPLVAAAALAAVALAAALWAVSDSAPQADAEPSAELAAPGAHVVPKAPLPAQTRAPNPATPEPPSSEPRATATPAQGTATAKPPAKRAEPPPPQRVPSRRTEPPTKDEPRQPSVPGRSGTISAEDL